MSSHHIIREDQEPALLILDATLIPVERIQELLEWSPTVMVSEEALPEVLTWGIKIDVVIAHHTNVQMLTTSLHDQFPLKIISYRQKGEELSTALNFLIASKQKAVNILSAVKLEEFEKFSSLDISVFHADLRWMFIRSGHFEKWLPAGKSLRLHPALSEPDIVAKQDGVIVLHREGGFWVSEIF
jgi:thiamine pyrophosphokinase